MLFYNTLGKRNRIQNFPTAIPKDVIFLGKEKYRSSKLSAEQQATLIKDYLNKVPARRSAEVRIMNRNTVDRFHSRLRALLLAAWIKETIERGIENHSRRQFDAYSFTRRGDSEFELSLSNRSVSGFFSHNICPPRVSPRYKLKYCVRMETLGSAVTCTNFNDAVFIREVGESGENLKQEESWRYFLQCFAGYIKRYRGISRTHLAGYLAEFVFFQSNPTKTELEIATQELFSLDRGSGSILRSVRFI